MVDKVAASMLVLALLSLSSLPVVFFDKERRKATVMWFVTASPYLVLFVTLVLGLTGRIEPFVDASRTRTLAIVGSTLAVASCSLLWSTVATHRVPISLWHQPDDMPASIVTHGPYRAVRHPFYASFCMLLLGGACIVPHYASLGTLVAGVSLLSVTARREERRLLSSSFGPQYASYMRHTGRLFPGIGKVEPPGGGAHALR